MVSLSEDEDVSSRFVADSSDDSNDRTDPLSDVPTSTSGKDAGSDGKDGVEVCMR